MKKFQENGTNLTYLNVCVNFVDFTCLMCGRFSKLTCTFNEFGVQNINFDELEHFHSFATCIFQAVRPEFHTSPEFFIRALGR